MTSHFFLFGGAITQERLSWVEGCLKFFFVNLNPENLLHHTRDSGEGIFVFLLTGDALYSLHEPETLRIWEIILSLPSVRIICDREELERRGISIEGLKMKHYDQVIDHNRLGVSGQQSFWNDVAQIARQHEQPMPSTIGYLQLESPYMHRSAVSAVRCLAAALDVHASVDLYAYLDGVHVSHSGQNPTESENIGSGLEAISEKAAKRGLQCQMIACSKYAASRGYSTWDDGKGQVVSACTIRPFRIRSLTEMIHRFRRNHVILGENVASIHMKKDTSPSFSSEETGLFPPLTILITSTPYGTENALGAISLGVAAAAQGIVTRVIFIEDGVYGLSGSHQLEKGAPSFNLQEIINLVAGSDNLQFFAFQPSLHLREVTKNPKLNAVLDIGMPELGNLLFSSPKGGQAGHQRVLFF
jgi:tRNA 2-thiouridine synthesizing protein C